MAIYHGCFGTSILIHGACFVIVLLFSFRGAETYNNQYSKSPVSFRICVHALSIFFFSFFFLL
jgi:hypothetical protein